MSGNRSPNVTWTKDGDISVILSADKELKINISGKANERRYLCTASNGIGFRSSSSADVIVKSE